MKDSQIPRSEDEQASMPVAAATTVGGWPPSPDGARQPASATASLMPYLDLSRELRDLLVPVRSRAEFRAELYRSLITDAQRQQVLRVLSLPGGAVDSIVIPTFDLRGRVIHRLRLGPGQSGRRWAIGAAAVGSAASLVGVGVLTYVRRRRQRNAA